MFGTVSLPTPKFKRLLLPGPPSAECATDSDVPSATRFLDSLLMRRNRTRGTKSKTKRPNQTQIPCACRSPLEETMEPDISILSILRKTGHFYFASTPRTCHWTCALYSGISCSRRLSPFKGIRNPNSIRVRARAAASCSQLSTKCEASSPTLLCNQVRSTTSRC
jgi:hypothetical protein